MTAKVFVDTNVVVYVYDARSPHKQAIAAEWLQRLWQERSGRTSIQVLNELYVTLTRKLAHAVRTEAAWDIVHALMAWEPQPLDRELLVCAREVERRYRIGWWDSLIVGAAQLQDCTVLLSEDLQAGMSFDQVRVVDPFASEVQEAAARYIVEPPLLAPRHRARGRPKKGASVRV